MKSLQLIMTSSDYLSEGESSPFDFELPLHPMFAVKTWMLVRLSQRSRLLMVRELPPVILLYVACLNLFVTLLGYFLLDDRKRLKLLNLAGPSKTAGSKPLVTSSAVYLDLLVS